MVVFDSSVFMLLLNPDAHSSVDNARERIVHLVSNLVEENETICIPAPVLTEVLVGADEDAEQSYLKLIEDMPAFMVGPYDQPAAILAATRMADAIRRGGRRIDAVTPNATNNKVSFDRQIVAIAEVQRATVIYSDDDDIHKYAEDADLEVIRPSELPLPPGT